MPAYFNFYQHCIRSIVFSRATFGPRPRQEALKEHIQSELQEISDGGGVEEWADVAILAIDGVTRYINYSLGEGAPVDVIAYLTCVGLWTQAEMKVNRHWNLVDLLTMGVVPSWVFPTPNQAILRALRSEGVQAWFEIILLAYAGAGQQPGIVIDRAVNFVKAIAEKQVVNEFRSWPDWRKSPDSAIFHYKNGQAKV